MNQDFLRETIRLSLEKMEAGEGGPFGGVVVQNGKIVGRGAEEVVPAALLAHEGIAHVERCVADRVGAGLRCLAFGRRKRPLPPPQQGCRTDSLLFLLSSAMIVRD